MHIIIELVIMLFVVGIFILMFRLLDRMDNPTESKGFKRPKRLSKIFKKKQPDQVISPSQRAEADLIQKELDEDYAVDSPEE